jgi:hypothetical protein
VPEYTRGRTALARPPVHPPCSLRAAKLARGRFALAHPRRATPTDSGLVSTIPAQSAAVATTCICVHACTQTSHAAVAAAGYPVDETDESRSSCAVPFSCTPPRATRIRARRWGRLRDAGADGREGGRKRGTRVLMAGEQAGGRGGTRVLMPGGRTGGRVEEGLLEYSCRAGGREGGGPGSHARVGRRSSVLASEWVHRIVPESQSRCRCGRGEPSPGADVAGGEPSPGAECGRRERCPAMAQMACG